MEQEALISLAQKLIAGKLAPDHFVAEVRASIAANVADADLDFDRARRCGYPEVVYAEGKSIASLISIVGQLQDAGQAILATRVSAEQAATVLAEFPDIEHNECARTLRMGTVPQTARSTSVAIVSAGTSDRPIAEEVAETLTWMGVPHSIIQDVGVAGPHRLPAHLEALRAASVVVVVAGMEGALPSVVGGYVASPVIAVPTSVGYGANFGGIAALLGMLNSCAANVTVVNIDAGFKAGYLAGLIANQSRPHSD